MSTSAVIDEIREPDLEEVAGFLTQQAAELGLVPAPSNLTPGRRLRWLLLENPSRHPDVPLGWCIRAEGRRLAGVMVCVPLRFAAGDFACTAVMICKFFVERSYRRSGLGSEMLARYLKLGERFPLFASSANAASGALFERSGGYVIPGTDHTMLGVARPGPLGEEWLYRRTKRAGAARVLALPMRLAPGRLARRARGSTPTDELEPLGSGDQVASLNLRRGPDNVLAVVRDTAHLRWRYFSGESERDAFRFRAPGLDERFLVVNHVTSGYRSQIRVLNVLDLWPPLDPASAPRLAALLARHYRGRFDALWLRSQPAAAEAALQDVRFVRHRFPAPLGWCMDPHRLLPTKDWYLVPGESE